MASTQKADLNQVPGSDHGTQTKPLDHRKRLADSDVKIELCTENDVEEVTNGLYDSFPDAFWARKEPLDKRPEESVRRARMAERLRPTFSQPGIIWIKAVDPATGEILGTACWDTPANPAVHNMFRRDAIARYGWAEKMGWTEERLDELWSQTDEEQWNGTFSRDDERRAALLKDERHWYLAPLFTLPQHQGKGVGSRLLKWAFEQADKTDPVTPLYLESAPMARVVYMHHGFVPQGEINMLRRGPKMEEKSEDVEEVVGKV